MRSIRHPPIDARSHAATVLACMAMAGCVVPSPDFPQPKPPYLEERQAVFDRLPELIVPGQTTRADVLRHLGEPDVRGAGDAWFVYQWAEDRTGFRTYIIGNQLSVVPLLNAQPVILRSIVVRFDEDAKVQKVDRAKSDDLCIGAGEMMKGLCSGGLVESPDWGRMLDKDYVEAGSGLFMLEPDERLRAVFRVVACRGDDRWIEGAAVVSSHAVVFLDRTAAHRPFDHVRLRLARAQIARARMEEAGNPSSPIAVLDLSDGRRIELAFGSLGDTTAAPPFDPVRTQRFVVTVNALVDGL